MAFNLPNFVGQNYTPDYSGIGDIVSNYFAGKNAPSEALIEKIKAQFAQPEAEANLQSTLAGLQSTQLANALTKQFGAQKEQADIDLKKQMAATYGMGGGRSNMTNQLLVSGLSQFKRDNPTLPDDKLQEGFSNVLGGQFTLNDGTPVNASNMLKIISGKLITSGAPAALTTQNVKAGQAEAELPVLEKYASAGLAPYGDTFNGYSPAQIADTFKNDDASQRKLGRFIASQGLQYEIAQNRIRLANGQPGVGSTEELMKLSQQNIKTKYPKLSAVARQEAANVMDEALKAGLQARKSVGVLGSGSIQGSGSGASQPATPGVVGWRVVNGKLVRG